MKPGRRPIDRILLGVLAFTLAGACGGPQEPRSDLVYTLSGDGAFSRVTNFQTLPNVGLLPWPLQLRVTDVYSRGGKVYLAVNGRGIAVAQKCGQRIEIIPFYNSPCFPGRTLTRFFPTQDGLVCHVYRDASFPESRPAGAPLAGDALVSIACDASGLRYAPLSLLFKDAREPWEAVGAAALDRETLVLEWKLAEQGRTRFRYSTYRLADGGEEEKAREWFYAHAASVRTPEKEGDPVAAALMQAATELLAAETPGCLVLFTVIGSADGGDGRYLFRDKTVRAKPVSIYHDVRVTRIGEGCSLLFGDGRFILARSVEQNTWRVDRLPALPSGYRYTVLEVGEDFLCAAWEQVDFYQVGRAGLVIRPGDFLRP